MPSPEDLLFARWCREAAPEALAALFDATAPRLLRLAIHLVGDAAAAEDLVQATFLAAIEQRARLDPARAVWPWLTGVLGHKAKKHRRQRARNKGEELLGSTIDAVEAVVEDPSRPLERRELDGEVARALDALDEPYRQVLVLRLRHGMEPADIAHVLERDPGTVRVQLHRGLEKLRTLLPATLASALVIGWAAPRGLAAVRAILVQEAAAAAAVGTTTLLVGGGLVAKKILVALAALAALLSFVLWRRTPTAAAPDAPALPSELVATTPPVAPDAPIPLRPLAVEQAEPSSAREPAAPAVAGVGTRVVDAESGTPIAGATLTLHAPREAHALELLRDAPELYDTDSTGRVGARNRADWPLLVEPSAAARFGREPSLCFDRPRAGEEPLASAISAADGSFDLDLGARDAVLGGAAPGYATRWRAVCEGEAPAVLELWRERDVDGVVIGPGLEPLDDVELVLIGIEIHAPEVSPAEREDNDASSTAPVAPMQGGETRIEGLGAWTVRTDDEGRFHLRVGAPQVVIDCLTPGLGQNFEPTYTLDGSELRIFLGRVPLLHVIDAASGAPVEHVRLLGRELGDQYVQWSGEFLAPDGYLCLTRSLSTLRVLKNLELLVWSDGHSSAAVTLPRADEAGTVEVPLERGATPELEGMVTRDGLPLAGAEVALLGRSPLQWGVDEDSLVDAAHTGADGRFRLSAPPGTHLLRVRAEPGPFLEKWTFPTGSWQMLPIPGREPYFETVTLPDEAPHVIDLGRTASVEVAVVDTNGAPQPGHTVILRDAGGRSEWRRTDEAGRFVFVRLPPGRFQVTAPRVNTNGSFASGIVEDVELAAGERGRARLEIPAADGPLHARVLARSVDDYSGWRARFDQGDWVELAFDGGLPMELRSDRFTLEVLSPDRRHWYLPIPAEVRDGHVFELESGAGRYRGELLRADASPWAGVAVSAVSVDPQSRARYVSSVTDANGAFELAGLGTALYHLQFQTDPERSPYDDWGNTLAGVHFWPLAPPSEEGTWLSLRAPDTGTEMRVLGTVKTAAGAPSEGNMLFIETESELAQGHWRVLGRAGLIHSDSRGAFELCLPRAPLVRVRAYAGKPSREVLTQSIEVVGQEVRLDLVLPE